MATTLILVESPTKAKKLSSYVDSSTKVLATKGHFVDLPPTGLGVNLETMEEIYEPIVKNDKSTAPLITQLKAEVAKFDHVLLASDPDREGEAIAWHCLRLLKPKSHRRIELHEINEKGLKEALSHERDVDMGMVESQRARRVLDRCIGYIVSSALRAKVPLARSAGRVQSCALRIIAERNAEIAKFKPEARYAIKGEFNQKDTTLDTWLIPTQKAMENITLVEEDPNDEKSVEKGNRLLSKTSLASLLTMIEKIDSWKVVSVATKETSVKPPPPFTTVDMQVAAANELGWAGDFTMSVAQALFQEGHITYHRTDSVRIAPQEQELAIKYIRDNFGDRYAPQTPNEFKIGGNAQNAHEAIRTAYINVENISLAIGKDGDTRPAQQLYTLIRNRFLASQAIAGTNRSLTTVITDANQLYNFQGVQTTTAFDGWRKFTNSGNQKDLKMVSEGPIQLIRAEEQQNYTRPKPHFKESSLTKYLEKHGIGRPSSYANTLSTLKKRNYINENSKKELIITELGIEVNAWQMQTDSKYTDLNFTANVEKALDDIAAGKHTRVSLLKSLYSDLSNVYGPYKERSGGFDRDAAPSQKALDFALIVAKTLNVTFTAEQQKTAGSVSDFLEKTKEAFDHYKNTQKADPESKMYKFAMSIATKKKLTIPPDILANNSLLHKWITKNK